MVVKENDRNISCEFCSAVGKEKKAAYKITIIQKEKYSPEDYKKFRSLGIPI